MKKHIITAITVLLAAVFVPLIGAQTVKLELGNIFKVKLTSNKEGLYNLEKISLRLSVSELTATEERVEVHRGFTDFILLRKGGGGVRVDNGRTWAETLFMTTRGEPGEDEKWIVDRRRVSDRHIQNTFGFGAGHTPGMKIELTNHIDLVYGVWTDTKGELVFNLGAMKTKITGIVKEETRTELQTVLGSRFRGFELKTEWIRETGRAPLYGGTSRRQKSTETVLIAGRDLELKVSNEWNVYESTGSNAESSWEVKFDNPNAQLTVRGKLRRTEGADYGFTQPEMKVRLRISKRTDAGTVGLEIGGDRTVRLVFSSEVPGVGAGKLRLTGDIDTQLSET